MKRLALATIAASLLCACGAEQTSPEGEVSPAIAHLTELVDTLQANALNRRKIDWASFRSAVFAKAAGAYEVEEAYPAIEEALRRLGDRGHSSYRSADGNVVLKASSGSCMPGDTTRPELPASIGYVRVRPFLGTGAPALEYANGIQQAIREADRPDLVGWIVDLRGNHGGNMWPMLAGIGPVLGEGVVGWFVDPDETYTPWSYEDGRARAGTTVIQQVSSPYRLERPNPRVAVLYDGRVASSGEAIAIAFRGRPNTRSFGTPTCGYSTGNRGFRLTNGAMLTLTTVTMADRHLTVYGDTVWPDEVIPDAAAAIEAAVEWLLAGALEK